MPVRGSIKLLLLIIENLTEATPVVAGVVLHEPLDQCHYMASAEDGYILYADPTDNVNNNNGTIYVGCVISRYAYRCKACYV